MRKKRLYRWKDRHDMIFQVDLNKHIWNDGLRRWKLLHRTVKTWCCYNVSDQVRWQASSIRAPPTQQLPCRRHWNTGRTQTSICTTSQAKLSLSLCTCTFGTALRKAYIQTKKYRGLGKCVRAIFYTHLELDFHLLQWRHYLERRQFQVVNILGISYTFLHKLSQEF